MIVSRSLWLVPATMLLIALASLPYGYYTLLRIVVCVCCCVIVYQAHERTGTIWSGWSIALIFLAILFNPLIRVHLTREIWAPIDVLAAAILVAHMLIERDRKWISVER